MRTSAVDPFVTFDKAASASLLTMFCRASIVADCGGVFSPRMLCGGLLNDGLSVGVSRLGGSWWGVGVEQRLESFSGDDASSRSTERRESFSGDFSGDLPSRKKSLFECGVEGRTEAFSGDLEPNVEPPSRKLLKSLTLPV